MGVCLLLNLHSVSPSRVPVLSVAHYLLLFVSLSF